MEQSVASPTYRPPSLSTLRMLPTNSLLGRHVVADACLHTQRTGPTSSEWDPCTLAAPTVTPAKRHMHIPRAHCTTAVARAGTHAHSTAVVQARRTPLLDRFRTPLPTSAGRAFPGASPYLKRACKSVLHAADRRLVVTRSTRSRNPRTLPLRWCMPMRFAGCSTAVVHATRPRTVETVRPRRNILSHPGRGGRGSRAVHRYSGLATLMRAGAAGATAVAPAQAQPQRWRGPVKRQPWLGRRVGPSS